MSVMVEVWYSKPANPVREGAITACISAFNGRVTCREEDGKDAVCLTVEFSDYGRAEAAIIKLIEAGNHVEGPVEYGD